MRFANHTLTQIELIEGDIRTATCGLVVVGRNDVLRNYYEAKLQARFAAPSWLRPFGAEVAASSDTSEVVLRIPVRPRGRSRRRIREIDRLQSALDVPLAVTISKLKVNTVCMAPISCRREDVVASAMIRSIWDVSVGAFLNPSNPFLSHRPRLFRIFNLGPVDAFIRELAHGQYASLRNGWHFNTVVQCDPAKRARYLRRRRFRFRPVDEGEQNDAPEPRSCAD